MAWLVGIICIILIVVFWRIFAPIAIGLAAIAVVGMLYWKIDSDQRDRKRQEVESKAAQSAAQAAAELRDRFTKANAAAVGRVWEVLTEADPASGAKMPRAAAVLSDNGLCQLRVEQRLDATKLTGIYCRGMRIEAPGEIEVKFDSYPASNKMRLERFSNGGDVYIPSRSSHSGHLLYGEFLGRMTVANKLALQMKVDGLGEHWFVFSMAGSSSALASIGAVAPAVVERREAAPRAQSVKPVPKQLAPQQPVSPQRGAEKKSGSPTLPANSPTLPANATLNVYGNDWVCIRGFRRTANECVAVTMPSNAVLNVYGNDWVCARGYRRSGNECIAVALPRNAQLNVYGNDWVCSRGYRRGNNECIEIELPRNAQVNVYGNDWVCSRGYRRAGNECSAVEMPANAQLNVYGNDWVCVRGYRRSGSECVGVGVVQ
jgi:hypothetical protein